MSEKNNSYYEKNKDKLLVKQREYYKTNKDKINEKNNYVNVDHLLIKIKLKDIMILRNI